MSEPTAAEGAGGELDERDERLREALWQLGELSDQLIATRAELAQTRARLQQLMASGAYRAGLLLAEAARSPAAAARQLPREAAGLLRRRRRHRARQASRTSTTSPTSAPTSTSPTGPAGSELSASPSLLPDSPASTAARLTRHLRLVPAEPGDRDLPVIAVVGSDRTAEALAAAAHVIRLRPHDGADLVRRVRPDLLLLDVTAGRPGELWHGLAEPEVVARQAPLIELLDAAEAVGAPLVVWLGTEPSLYAALDPVLSRADAVLGPEWFPGVDLALFHPELSGGGGSGAISLVDAGALQRDAEGYATWWSAQTEDGHAARLVLPPWSPVQAHELPTALRASMQRPRTTADLATLYRGAASALVAPDSRLDPWDAAQLVASGTQIAQPTQRRSDIYAVPAVASVPSCLAALCRAVGRDDLAAAAGAHVLAAGVPL